MAFRVPIFHGQSRSDEGVGDSKPSSSTGGRCTVALYASRECNNRLVAVFRLVHVARTVLDVPVEILSFFNLYICF